MTISGPQFTDLLLAGDPDPLVVTGTGESSPLMLVCDHAGRAVPRALGRLGLPYEAFERHIAWDIGIAPLALRLGEMLGAPVFEQAYSRLVIDCNRAPDHSHSILAVSDGVEIPGNQGISMEDAERRRLAIHAPYHVAIAAELDRRGARGLSTILVCLHSFTPSMAGFDRPWHVGVLHMGVSPLSRAMLNLLSREPGLVVGDNQPYAMDGSDYTAPRHAIARGQDFLELEIRQDLIATPAGQSQYAALLARLLPLLSLPE